MLILHYVYICCGYILQMLMNVCLIREAAISGVTIREEATRAAAIRAAYIVWLRINTHVRVSNDKYFTFMVPIISDWY